MSDNNKYKSFLSPPLGGGRVGLIFKQACNLLRQEKLFSSIYIIGTALSITMVMILSIILYIRLANIYPETNRDRMLVAGRGMIHTAQGGYSNGPLSLRTIENCFSNLEKAEVVSVYCMNWGEEYFVQHPANRSQIPVAVQLVDHNYWNIFSFLFKEGKPFTSADVQSGIKTAVISESMARNVFGETGVVGNYISMNFRQYRVAGIVKDPSYALPGTFAHIWIPYTTDEEACNDMWDTNQVFGRMGVYILAPSKKQLKAIKEEASENIRKYATTFGDDTFTMGSQPYTYWQSALDSSASDDPDFFAIIFIYVFIFLLFLVVPAVSLSGMVDSRMERRISECGIRRAFGAPNSTLMFRIISENMLFTLLGGIVGLLLSYFFILLTRNSILELGKVWVELPIEGTGVVFSPGMLLNGTVFAIALGICIILNLFSAIVPAWRASRRQIVYSLNAKSN